MREYDGMRDEKNKAIGQPSGILQLCYQASGTGQLPRARSDRAGNRQNDADRSGSNPIIFLLDADFHSSSRSDYK